MILQLVLLLSLSALSNTECPSDTNALARLLQPADTAGDGNPLLSSGSPILGAENPLLGAGLRKARSTWGNRFFKKRSRPSNLASGAKFEN